MGVKWSSLCVREGGRGGKGCNAIIRCFWYHMSSYATDILFYCSKFMLRNSMGACMMTPTPRMPRPPSPGIRGAMLYPMTFATSASPPPAHLLYPTNPIRTGSQIPSFYSAPLPHHAFYEPSMSMVKRLNDQVSSILAEGASGRWGGEEEGDGEMRGWGLE